MFLPKTLLWPKTMFPPKNHLLTKKKHFSPKTMFHQKLIDLRGWPYTRSNLVLVFLRLYQYFLQDITNDFLRTLLEHSKDSLPIYFWLFHNFSRAFSGLSQNSQNFLRNPVGKFQDFRKAVEGFLKNFVRIILGFVQPLNLLSKTFWRPFHNFLGIFLETDPPLGLFINIILRNERTEIWSCMFCSLGRFCY